ncbi:hypothetical protein [Azohydromonas aeria]|uniref:hypothetical protein n=1 Tax=Azohydromonas aeria TaxID=2590212 RepID=UPI0012FABF55|nr:hypothetical protein [Azohydromonas aeria]
MQDTWQPVGGIKENPGTFSSGDRIILVERRADGVMRRTVTDITGRDDTQTRYTGDPRDQGGPYPPDGVVSFRSLDNATAHLQKRKEAERVKGVRWTCGAVSKPAASVEEAIRAAQQEMRWAGDGDGGSANVWVDGVLAAGIECSYSTGWAFKVERHGQWAKSAGR